MKTVLFAWELGAALGHASVMAEIARNLQGDNLRLVVAGRDLVSTRIGFAGVEHLLVPSPSWPPHIHFGATDGQASYLDTLVLAGFADRARLGAAVAGWLGLLDLIRPDVIVADHSPALTVARLARGVPVVAVGSGYTMPPVEYDHFPPLKPDRAPIASEARIVALIAETLSAAGGVKPPASLPAWFRTEDRVVFSFPELDPYRAFRREPLHAPPGKQPSFAEPPVEPRIFIYLGEEVPHLAMLVQAVADLDLPVKAYLRGNVGPLAEFLSLRGHTTYKQPPRLDEELPTVSHVLTSGGIFTAHAALAAGRPQLIVPLHNESKLNFDMLDNLGVARNLVFDDETTNLAEAIDAFITDHDIARNARGWASVLGGREQPDGAKAALSAIRRHLG